MQRVMGSIVPEYRQSVYKKWNELVNSKEGETLKKIICIDGKTMGMQSEIAEKIKQKRADDTLAVKENQKKRYREIREYFEDGELLKEIKCSGGYKVTKEKSHSKIETREYYQCDRLGWMQEKSRWKGIKQRHRI